MVRGRFPHRRHYRLTRDGAPQGINSYALPAVAPQGMRTLGVAPTTLGLVLGTMARWEGPLLLVYR